MSSHCLDVVQVDDPKAIVLLFGWLGAERRHVLKYAALYNARGCSTISGVAATFDIMLTNKHNLREFALEASRQAATLIRQSAKIPVIVHVFSNGGAFVLEQLQDMILEDNNADVALVGTCLGRQVFDSSPCYLYPSAGLQAIASSSPNRIVAWLLQSMFLAYMMLNWIFALLQSKPDRPREFWNHVSHVNGITTRQLYLYSTADDICDYNELEKLICLRSKLPNNQVMVQKFVDSGHVQHLRMHPKEYESAIDRLLASVVEEKGSTDYDRG